MNNKILLAHGGGGEEMNSLIGGLIFKVFSNDILLAQNDSAILPKIGGKLAFTTDSFTVTPREFAGGNIGKIAVCGTINDLCMAGAKPLFMSCALIIEEGFDMAELENILHAMKQNADNASVKIVCGDTKVVPKGKCDGIFINTSGIGEIYEHSDINMENFKKGQKIILSGDIGRHGAVILAARDELALSSELKSDCKVLTSEIDELYTAKISPIAMRDATRGGLSAVLNEWASFGGANIDIYEEKIAVSDEVQGICEMLGFEPYDLANEGTFVLCVDEKDAQKSVEILQKFNKFASIIGEIGESNKKPNVILYNEYGSSRYLEPPKGELLPRIC